MQYIIGFNGPPKSGKDTIAAAMRDHLDSRCNIPVVIDHLARPMRQMAMSLTGNDPTDFKLYNSIKDSPQSLLRRAAKDGGLDTIRQLMIATSEDFIKPRYGQDFWARKMLQAHVWLESGMPGILFVPDIGFPAEVGVFDDLFPKIKTLIVQIDRPGITWAGDSRVPCEGLRNTAHLFNDKTPEWAAEWVWHHMVDFLGWDLGCEI